MRRAPAVLVGLALSAPLVIAAPANAAVSLDSRLVDFTPWLNPEGTLRAVIEVTNSGTDTATRIQVGLQIYEGIDTRSQLERTFDGSLGQVISSDTIPVTTEVGPGATETITVEKPLAEIRFFSGSPSDRAYPVRLVVRSGKVAAPPLDSHMVFFKRPAAVPLGVVLVVPIHSPAIYDTRMRVASEKAASSVTEGRVAELLQLIEAHPTTSVTLAPSGLLVDTLSDLADGYSIPGDGEAGADSSNALKAGRLVERLRATASSPVNQVVAFPYSAANLAWLSLIRLESRAQAQVAEGSARVRQTIATSPTGWLLPGMGVIDEPALAVIQRSGFTGVIVTPKSLVAKRSSLTPATPAEIRTRTSQPIQALVSDAGLDARISPAEELSPIIARQRFLAETAMIMLERPGQERVVVAVPPANWAPAAAFLEGILLALEQSPWMRAITPDAAASQIKTRRRVELLPAETILASDSRPPTSYEAALVEGRGAIERYEELGPPASRLGSMERTLLIAESSDWWPAKRLQNQGMAFARAVTAAVDAEFAKIQAPASQTITLTSRTGVIPLVVSTRTDYPVQVVIELHSDKLRFTEGTRIRTVLEPPAQTIRVPVVTEASGTFPVKVVVYTSNRSVELGSSRLVVKSTAYNVVAVAITIGAGVFMLLGWVSSTIRRRVVR